MNVVIEAAIITTAVVGAVVAGNAAHRIAERNGCTPVEASAAGCLAAGLTMAVPVAAIVAGASTIVVKGVEAYKNRDAIIASAKAKTDAHLHAVKSA